MTESEIRCSRCEARHPQRQAPLLATVRGTEILAPIRLSAAQAKRLGIPRSGLFWRRPIVTPTGELLLKCRRCGKVRLLQPA